MFFPFHDNRIFMKILFKLENDFIVLRECGRFNLVQFLVMKGKKRKKK